MKLKHNNLNVYVRVEDKGMAERKYGDQQEFPPLYRLLISFHDGILPNQRRATQEHVRVIRQAI